MPLPPLQRSWHSLAILVVLVVLALFPASSNAYTLSLSSCLGRQRALVMKAGEAGSERPLSQSPLASCSRADVLRGGFAVLSGATLTSLVVAPWGVRPATAAEEEKEKVESSTFIPFVASSKTFTFDYPDSWKLAPKLVQTHQEEVRRHVGNEARRKRKLRAHAFCTYTYMTTGDAEEHRSTGLFRGRSGE